MIPQHPRQGRNSAFTMLEMLVSMSIFSVCVAITLTTTISMMKSGVQTQAFDKANLESQLAVDQIVSMVRQGAIPLTSLSGVGTPEMTMFVGEYEGKNIHDANAGTQMLKIDNFKRKGIKRNLKSINKVIPAGGVTSVADLNPTAIEAASDLAVGDWIAIQTNPVIVTRIVSINNPKAANRTFILQDKLPIDVPAGTKIKVGKQARMVVMGSELRYYADTSKSDFKVLCRNLTSGKIPFSVQGNKVNVDIEQTVGRETTNISVRAQTSVYIDTPGSFYSEFNASAGGGL